MDSNFQTLASQSFNATDLIKSQSDMPLSQNDLEMVKCIKKKSMVLDFKLRKK